MTDFRYFLNSSSNLPPPLLEDEEPVPDIILSIAFVLKFHIPINDEKIYSIMVGKNSCQKAAAHTLLYRRFLAREGNMYRVR